MEFVRTTAIDAPARVAFDWHARPGAFERLTPPWEPVELVFDSGGIQAGDRKVIRMKLGPLKKDWVAEHREFEDGHLFQDVQVSGPFAEWVHTHTITPTGPETCELEDRIRYRLPLGAAGRIAGGRFAESKLDRMFEYRHRITRVEIARHYALAKKTAPIPHPVGSDGDTAVDSPSVSPAEITPMHVLVTGSSGLVGSNLIPYLTTGGHTVSRLVRSEPQNDSDIRWDINAGEIEREKLEGIDAVVHLAGENIAKGRWTDAKKQRIRDSRVKGTRLLAETLAGCDRKPSVFYSASAIGYYGDRGDEVLTESSEPGEGFLPDVSKEWEAAADPARDAGIRTVHGRFGIILSDEDGALKKMLPPFKLGAGGKLGNGRQYWSWIAIDDVIGSIHHALASEDLAGALNVTAPNPATNAEFTKTLGRVISRPTLIPAPKFGMRLLLGEMADDLLFASARVIPERLQTDGYQFAYPDLEPALRHLLGRG